MNDKTPDKNIVAGIGRAAGGKSHQHRRIWNGIVGRASPVNRGGAIDVILRIYPSIRTTSVVDDVAALIKRVEQETEVRHVLVDLMYQADTVDQMLEQVAGVLTAAR